MKILISFRVHVKCKDNEACLHWYIDNFTNWIKFRKYTICKMTAGIHLNAKSEHIHVHYEVDGTSLLANPIQSFKYDYKNERISKIYNLEQKDLKTIPKDILGERYLGRINISLKMVAKNSDLDGVRFLQYPLKEKLVIATSHINNDELEHLVKNASVEYENSLQKQKNKELKEEKSMSEWEELIELIECPYKDGKVWEINTQSDVARCVLQYFKQRKKPPTIKYMFDLAERLSFKLGIISIDELLIKKNI